jgi:hypothetical protein
LNQELKNLVFRSVQSREKRAVRRCYHFRRACVSPVFRPRKNVKNPRKLGVTR